MLKWGASDAQCVNDMYCVLPMAVVPSLPHVGFGPNDHREDTLNFTFVENKALDEVFIIPNRYYRLSLSIPKFLGL